MRAWLIRHSLAAALLAGLPGIALAHVESGAASGFAAGWLQPLSGADHVLAMVAVGGGWQAIAGIALAVGIVVALVAAGVASWCAGAMRIVWRAIGSWIAASGLLLLGWSRL